jgi:hypothetical protein
LTPLGRSRRPGGCSPRRGRCTQPADQGYTMRCQPMCIKPPEASSEPQVPIRVPMKDCDVGLTSDSASHWPYPDAKFPRPALYSTLSSQGRQSLNPPGLRQALREAQRGRHKRSPRVQQGVCRRGGGQAGEVGEGGKGQADGAPVPARETVTMLVVRKVVITTMFCSIVKMLVRGRVVQLCRKTPYYLPSKFVPAASVLCTSAPRL